MKEIKFADWRLTGFWLAMTLAALITGFVLGWCWRDRPGALGHVSILSAMTALGTVGAAAGAVGIACWQQFTLNREKYLKAVHAAARSYMDLALMEGALKNLMPQILEIGEKGASEAIFTGIFMQLDAIQKSHTLPDPVDLVPLKGNCGPRLASAIGKVEVALKLLGLARRYYVDGGDPNVNERRMHFGFINGMLHEAVRNLHAVSIACQLVAMPVDSPFQ